MIHIYIHIPFIYIQEARMLRLIQHRRCSTRIHLKGCVCFGVRCNFCCWGHVKLQIHLNIVECFVWLHCRCWLGVTLVVYSCRVGHCWRRQAMHWIVTQCLQCTGLSHNGCSVLLFSPAGRPSTKSEFRTQAKRCNITSPSA